MQHRITRPTSPATGRPSCGWLEYRGHFIYRHLQLLEFEGSCVEWIVHRAATTMDTFDPTLLDSMDSRYTLRAALARIDFEHEHHLTN